jgi:hypothetical protein
MDLSIRVIAFNTLCDRSHFASRHPHLSVVQIVKELLNSTAPSRPFPSNPSAAKRRDYEELPSNRQAVSLNFFCLFSLPQPPENPAAAEELRII